MTPQAMMSKFVVDGPWFLGEMQKDELWTFLQTPINEVLAPFNNDYGIYDYDRLRLAVIAEAKAEYAAQEDIWGNEHAGVQHIRENRERWIIALSMMNRTGVTVRPHVVDAIIQALKGV